MTTLVSQLLGILSALALLLIATVGRQMPSSTCFLIEILNLEKISGYLLQNVFKFATSLSYKKPCLTYMLVVSSKKTVVVITYATYSN